MDRKTRQFIFWGVLCFLNGVSLNKFLTFSEYWYMSVIVGITFIFCSINLIKTLR